MSREFTLATWRSSRAATLRAVACVANRAPAPRARARGDEARRALVRATVDLVRQREASGQMRRTGERSYEIRPR